MSADKLQAVRDRLPSIKITATGFSDNKTERLAYTLTKYHEAVLGDGRAWQEWERVRGLVCDGLGCAPNMADSAINELCKTGRLECEQKESVYFVKARLDLYQVV